MNKNITALAVHHRNQAISSTIVTDHFCRRPLYLRSQVSEGVTLKNKTLLISALLIVVAIMAGAFVAYSHRAVSETGTAGTSANGQPVAVYNESSNGATVILHMVALCDQCLIFSLNMYVKIIVLCTY